MYACFGIMYQRDIFDMWRVIFKNESQCEIIGSTWPQILQFGLKLQVTLDFTHTRFLKGISEETFYLDVIGQKFKFGSLHFTQMSHIPISSSEGLLFIGCIHMQMVSRILVSISQPQIFNIVEVYTVLTSWMSPVRWSRVQNIKIFSSVI